MKDLRQREKDILRILGKTQQVESRTTIAEILNLSKSLVSSYLNSLKRKGYIDRIPLGIEVGWLINPKGNKTLKRIGSTADDEQKRQDVLVAIQLTRSLDRNLQSQIEEHKFILKKEHLEELIGNYYNDSITKSISQLNKSFNQVKQNIEKLRKTLKKTVKVQ